jgi:ABC-2 type transport system permease protein
MINDIGTVLSKELSEILQQGGRRGKMSMLVFVGVFGIFLPWQSGRYWITSSIPLFYFAWLPFMQVATVIADAFAGERERHTLETLLASRLPDRAILFGKVGAAVAYGWGFTMVSMVVGLITVNVISGHGRLLIYSAGMGATIIAASLLTGFMSAGAGILISLRAATVRQAQQTLGLIMMGMTFVPVLGLQALPIELRHQLILQLAGNGSRQLVVFLLVLGLLVDALLLAASIARFQRSRLILD